MVLNVLIKRATFNKIAPFLKGFQFKGNSKKKDLMRLRFVVEDKHLFFLFILVCMTNEDEGEAVFVSEADPQGRRTKKKGVKV